MQSQATRRLALMALLALTSLAAAWVERSWWPLAFPGLGIAALLTGLPVRVLLALASLSLVTASADLALEGLGYMHVGEAANFAYHLVAVENPMEKKVVRGDCPSYHFKPTGGRDDRGWLRFESVRKPEDANGPTVVAVVIGDSLPKRVVAQDLAGAMGDAGIAGTVVDTSVGGYDLRDESCVLDEVMDRMRPDLVIHTLCPNDFYDFTLRLDLAGHRRNYLVGADYDERLKRFDLVPLLLESGTPWVERWRGDLLERFGDDVVFDYDDQAGFHRAVSATGGYADGMRRLRETIEKYGKYDVPAVFVLYPFAYRADRAPGKILFDEVYGTLDESRAASTDLRRVFSLFPSEALKRDDGHIPEAERPLNFLHYNRNALDMSLFLVLKEAGRAYGLEWTAAVRRALLVRMAESGATKEMIRSLDPAWKGGGSIVGRALSGVPDLDCLKGRAVTNAYRLDGVEYLRKGARIELGRIGHGPSFHVMVARHKGGEAYRRLRGGLAITVESTPGLDWTMDEEKAARALGDIIDSFGQCPPDRDQAPATR